MDKKKASNKYGAMAYNLTFGEKQAYVDGIEKLLGENKYAQELERRKKAGK